MKIFLPPEDQGPFLALLRDNDVSFTRRMFFRDSASDAALFLFAEIIDQKGSWAALAAVTIAYIKVRHGRKITVKSGDQTIKIEGLSEQELAKILSTAEELALTHTKDEA